MASPAWRSASDRPSAAGPYGFQAGLLTEDHPIRTPSQRERQWRVVRTVPITALGTWRSFTAFPILPGATPSTWKRRHFGTEDGGRSSLDSTPRSASNIVCGRNPISRADRADRHEVHPGYGGG